MLLCKKIKLHVSEQDAATLEFMPAKCRGLYNWWAMQRREGRSWPGWKAAKVTLQESKRYDPEPGQAYGKLLQAVYFRLDGAMQAFFRRVKAGEKPGFLRVRPRHSFFTLCYPALYLKIEGDKLPLPTGERGRKKRFTNIVARMMETPPRQFRELVYKCVRYGKGPALLDERNTSKACSCWRHLQAMPLYKRAYTCTACGLVIDRDENAAVNLLHRYVARLGPHTERISVRCADVFTAIDNVKILRHLERQERE